MVRIWLVAVAGFGMPVSAAAPDPDCLRTAMIYNLTKFVRWPDDVGVVSRM